MSSKNSYLSFNEDVFFTFFTFTGLYFLSGNKYINIWTFVSIITAKHGGKILREILTHKDELEPGGTTPWNPFKFPGKGMTPAIKKGVSPGKGTTPWNPLKIPGKGLTPAKHN